jgi:hypothetical protein
MASKKSPAKKSPAKPAKKGPPFGKMHGKKGKGC